MLFLHEQTGWFILIINPLVIPFLWFIFNICIQFKIYDVLWYYSYFVVRFIFNDMDNVDSNLAYIWLLQRNASTSQPMFNLNRSIIILASTYYLVPCCKQWWQWERDIYGLKYGEKNRIKSEKLMDRCLPIKHVCGWYLLAHPLRVWK